MDVGKRIQDIRKQKKIKQKDIAEKLGISAAAISAIENNGNGLTVQTLIKIANALNVPVEQFVKENEMIDWIPVSEKLPTNENDPVLICCKDGKEYVFFKGYYSKEKGWYEYRQKYLNEMVISSVDVKFGKTVGAGEFDPYANSFEFPTSGGTVTVTCEGADSWEIDYWLNDMAIAWVPLEYNGYMEGHNED